VIFLGKAHHTVDLLYTFLTYQAHLPENLATLAETIAGQWLTFANGGQPWKAYDQQIDGSSTLMYYGPNGKDTEVPERSKPAYGRIRFCEEFQNDIGLFAGRLRGVIAEE
jgi:hypothetical protein